MGTFNDFRIVLENIGYNPIQGKSLTSKYIVHLKSIIMSAQKVLIGALAGIVAGVAIGVLVAPAEGSETRQRISDTADSLKRKLRKLRGVTADELMN